MPNNKKPYLLNKSVLKDGENWTDDELGFSYYAFCIENALWHVMRARMLVKGDPVDDNHELPRIESLLVEAYAAI